MQCNRLWVRDLQHSNYPHGGAEIFGVAYRRVIGQFNIDSIEMSAVEEVKPDVSLPRTLPLRLRCFCIKPVRVFQLQCVPWRQRLGHVRSHMTQLLKTVFSRVMKVCK